MNVTYKRHPLNKKRPAPSRVMDPAPQLGAFSKTLIAFARDLRESLAPLRDFTTALATAGHEARLHARHPEYHGGRPLAKYSLRTGAYVPVRSVKYIDGRDGFLPLNGGDDAQE